MDNQEIIKHACYLVGSGIFVYLVELTKKAFRSESKQLPDFKYGTPPPNKKEPELSPSQQARISFTNNLMDKYETDPKPITVDEFEAKVSSDLMQPIKDRIAALFIIKAYMEKFPFDTVRDARMQVIRHHEKYGHGDVTDGIMEQLKQIK